MNEQDFSFRRYQDGDAEVLYVEYAKYATENIQPYIWGPSVIPEKRKFLEGIRDYSNKVHRPPFICDNDNQLIGVYHITFHNANKYHELNLHLWKNLHLMEPILKQIIDQSFYKERPDTSVLVEIPEYVPEMKHAAENLGLRCVGTIRNYLCHGKDLCDKFFYVITAREWFSKS